MRTKRRLVSHVGPKFRTLLTNVAKHLLNMIPTPIGGILLSVVAGFSDGFFGDYLGAIKKL